MAGFDPKGTFPTCRTQANHDFLPSGIAQGSFDVFGSLPPSQEANTHSIEELNDLDKRIIREM